MNVAGRYTAMVIFTIGTYGVNSLILGWCGSVCAQTKEKKAVAISIVTSIMNVSTTKPARLSFGHTKSKSAGIEFEVTKANIVYQVSFVWTPYLWFKEDGPRYIIALAASAGFSMGTAAVAWVARIIMIRRNNKLKQQESEEQNFYVY